MIYSDETIQRHFTDIPPKIIDLLLWVREEMIEMLPAHQEGIRWNCIVFDKPNAKTTVKDNIVHIRARKSKVEICFGLGVFLKDPDGVLEGNGRYKRLITIKTKDSFPSKHLKSFIKQTCDFDSDRVLYRLLPKDDYQNLKRGI